MGLAALRTVIAKQFLVRGSHRLLKMLFDQNLAEILVSLITPTLASLFFVLLWIFFFYIYSPKKTIHIKFLSIAFFLGIGSAFLALTLEQVVFFYFNIDTSFLEPSFVAKSLNDLVFPLLFSFLFVAIIEESSKFVFVKKYFDITSINQVIDGMKICLAMGLGFAFIENIIYFSKIPSLSPAEIASLFILRGAFSTLAHGIYGIIMGYYLSLGKFYERLHTHFVWRALFASILIHGLFDFFLIVQLGFYSLFMLIFLLAAAIIWYNDRKNLELRIISGDQTIIVPPFLAERLELEVWKSKHTSQAEYLDRLWSILFDVEERKNEPYIKK